MQLTPLEDTVARLGKGEFVALLDRPEREGEADLLLGVEYVSGEAINFMATYARGLIIVAMELQRMSELDIRLIEPRYHGENVPAFGEPVDYTPAVTTGISAFERAATIRALADPAAAPEDFMRPGHVFPLAAAPGGLGQREGHTEGAIALAKLAGIYPAVAMCEIMAPDGHMARGDDLATFVREHDIALTTVTDVAEGAAGQWPCSNHA